MDDPNTSGLPKAGSPPSALRPHVSPATQMIDLQNRVNGVRPEAAAAAAAPTSLDTQETCVRDFEKWLKAGDGSPWQGNLKLQIGAPTLACKFRHSGWWPTRSKIIESLFRTRQSDSRIRNFCTCGNAAWVQVSNDDPDRARIVQNNCHDRLCTPCANQRSMRIRDALRSQIAGEAVTFITLTLRGLGEKLSDLIDRLYRSFRALRGMPLWSDKVQGGAAMIEIKWDEKGRRWHPHLHILAKARYIEQGELTAAWRAITKDSFIVDIRKVAKSESIATYVTKYVTKPIQSSFIHLPDKLDEAIEALKGRRLCMCFGSWFGTPLDLAEGEELADDLVDAHGYTNFLPLEQVLDRANAGDLEMQRLLERAKGDGRWKAMQLRNSS